MAAGASECCSVERALVRLAAGAGEGKAGSTKIYRLEHAAKCGEGKTGNNRYIGT
ncbi:MAG: HvfA family oxazolone/thioamide-modified RiPP metallophore [Candidatus Angelobacter sp.]